MQDWIALFAAMALFMGVGYILNNMSESVYWKWRDWQGEREDAKMLRDQEKQEENVPDNVVKLDDVRKTKTIISNYNDDTIH